MTILSVSDPEVARAILEEVPLPQPRGPGPERGPALAIPAEFLTDSAQAVAVGSHVTEFAAEIPAALRSDITNSFLVAQLAANAFLRDVGGGTQEWYDRFTFVLVNSGWDAQPAAETILELSSSSGQLYKEILPALKASFGGAVASTSIVLGALKALSTRSPDRPWITLFERESQRAQANQFQVSYVEAPGGSKPRVSLSSFALDARQSVTRVLFFRFSELRATLRYSNPILTMNEPVFNRVKDVVEERIRDQLGSFIAGIDL